jgi:hypothetical protein
MKNTIKALDQFTQALGPMLPPPALDPPTPAPPDPAPPAAHPTAGLAARAGNSQTAPTSCSGITRRAPRGDWPRWAKLAVLALMIGLGFPRVVRATERAAASYWRQQMGSSLAGRRAPQRGHASPHRAAPRRPASTRT